MTTLNKTFQSNPDLCPGPENLGYTQGLTKDGSYFEAEKWVWNEEMCVSFLLNEKWEFAPESEFMAQRAEKQAADAGELTYVQSESDRSELIQGMVIRDEALTHEETVRYVTYLTEMGLVEFLTNVCNGYTQALTDVCGNEVIQCVITLEGAAFGAEAVTPLRFEPFQTHKQEARPDLKVILCGAQVEKANDGKKLDTSELIDRANKALAAIPNNEDMTDLERIEYDAEYGYFQEEEEVEEGTLEVPTSGQDTCSDEVGNKYDQAYECTTGHKEDVKNGELCSCLNCCQTFPPSFIYRWVDDGETPVCPFCGVDMVFSHDSVDFPVDEFFANALGAYGETQTI